MILLPDKFPVDYKQQILKGDFFAWTVRERIIGKVMMESGISCFSLFNIM